ncbi:LLM class F420-dependent oxidoreductase [soil metagenome]|nr:TIGR03560 family F420-dependent LLM class oxidoreductase [Chloroflexia bacterium]
MVKLGVMIEGQEGLTWERWRRIIETADTNGFNSVWRSDHLFSLMGSPDRDCIALWPSLNEVGYRSSRLEFGQLVSPITFRHPVHLAIDAVAADELSGGRFLLGVGAGWNENEHKAFGFPLPQLKERMDRFEEGLKVITLLLSDEKVSFQGTYFQLDEAQSRPSPTRGSKVPIVIGGGGEKRTLRLVAEYADEWNITPATLEAYAGKVEVLLRHCEDVGRDPETIRRSIMLGHIIGRNQDELKRRAASIQKVFNAPSDADPEELISRFRERGMLVGAPEEIVEQIQARAEQGVERIMLQTHDQTDMEALELFASDVMPHIS